MYKSNIEERSCNHCCLGKAISMTHSERVFVVLVIHHEMRKHCVILLSVAFLALAYFSTSHKRHDFG